MCCRKTPHDDHGGVEPCPCARCRILVRLSTRVVPEARERAWPSSDELFVASGTRVEALLPYFRGQGRPEEDRAALARAFIAKAVFIPTTRGLIERRAGYAGCAAGAVPRLPSEATFSRAFSEFDESRLAACLHETLIARTMDGHLVEHISRDATAIEAREKAAPKPKAAAAQAGAAPQGRPEGAEPAGTATDDEPSADAGDLPRACDVGASATPRAIPPWIGYKLHVDTADGGIPISCIMTSASTHDSQVAIPLGTLTAGRVENLYDLMDAAYDFEIWAHCLLGHKPHRHPRRSVETRGSRRRRRSVSSFEYVVRSGSERINGRLKDEFGGRRPRALRQGSRMFGMMLTASQLNA